MENKAIMLSEEERKALDEFTKKGVHSAMLIRRAKVILALEYKEKVRSFRIEDICKSIGISRRALNDIRNDFLQAESIETFLTRKKRETPPVEPKITGDVEAHIIALACSEPPEGYAKWTLYLLAQKAVELNYVGSLSHMSVKRVLKKQNISLI